MQPDYNDVTTWPELPSSLKLPKGVSYRKLSGNSAFVYEGDEGIFHVSWSEAPINSNKAALNNLLGAVFEARHPGQFQDMIWDKICYAAFSGKTRLPVNTYRALWADYDELHGQKSAPASPS